MARYGRIWQHLYYGWVWLAICQQSLDGPSVSEGRRSGRTADHRQSDNGQATDVVEGRFVLPDYSAHCLTLPSGQGAGMAMRKESPLVLPHETGTEAAQCSYCINGRLGVKVTIVQAYKIFVFPPY